MVNKQVFEVVSSALSAPINGFFEKALQQRAGLNKVRVSYILLYSLQRSVEQLHDSPGIIIHFLPCGNRDADHCSYQNPCRHL
jgi:hypothetical protein